MVVETRYSKGLFCSDFFSSFIPYVLIPNQNVFESILGKGENVGHKHKVSLHPTVYKFEK